MLQQLAACVGQACEHGQLGLELVGWLGVDEAEAERRFLAALVIADHVEKEISGLARPGAGEATTDQRTDQADRT